jgi:NADH dehydrogenase
MVTIGRNAAIAYIWGHAFAGFLAWILWLRIHLYRLIGFRNRLLVLINWVWDYLFYERAVRLIVPLPVSRTILKVLREVENNNEHSRRSR